MAATILNSARAVEVSVYVVRAFVQLRELLAGNRELARRFDELEQRLERRLTTDDQAIAGILDAIRQLMQPPNRASGRLALSRPRRSRPSAEQTATLLFLPNPRADEKAYMEGFKLNRSEFELVRQLDESRHTFLVKQGHRRALARLDLEDMDDFVAKLSCTTESVAALDAIRATSGDNPAFLLPRFRESVTQRFVSAGHARERPSIMNCKSIGPRIRWRGEPAPRRCHRTSTPDGGRSIHTDCKQ